MNELIKVEGRAIGGDQVQTINARDLHAFLGNGENFTTWIKDRIQQYGFIENHDFVSFSENTKKPQGGRPAVEYVVTLDMGKELAMVERNEKGKQARQYFIECEKRAKTPVLSLPDFANPAVAARAWAEQYEAKQAALVQLEAAKPAVEFVIDTLRQGRVSAYRMLQRLLAGILMRSLIN
ncbi:antA/AntB antirepressor family protein [Nitrosovibrio tenuis]|uniref:Phage anti-repressor protein n=1 Tax=Nitrosovibrio tenuis TaxID=1233 RepID=A0A1H7NQW0_9PROT|nr:antA/AntB antirepressor family protein [Nitrosovibrio tenuis]SEL25862.1 Phage anti-repressor protein [Nitrosovibrio tenuis]